MWGRSYRCTFLHCLPGNMHQHPVKAKAVCVILDETTDTCGRCGPAISLQPAGKPPLTVDLVFLEKVNYHHQDLSHPHTSRPSSATICQQGLPSLSRPLPSVLHSCRLRWKGIPSQSSSNPIQCLIQRRWLGLDRALMIMSRPWLPLLRCQLRNGTAIFTLTRVTLWRSVLFSVGPSGRTGCLLLPW